MSQELDQVVRSAIEKIGSGSITLSDLLTTVAPPAEVEKVPDVLPLPVQITESQKAALDKLTEVYGQVVPTDRRKLEPQEITKLVEEKVTFDEIKKMATRRHEDIRTTIFNHLDVEAEESGKAEGATRDKNGHYVLAGEVHGEPGTEKKFVRQVSNGSPTLSEAALKELSEDPDSDLTHEDYLAITTQTRYVDENKLMLHLKKHPHLMAELSKAVEAGRKTASLYARKP